MEEIHKFNNSAITNETKTEDAHHLDIPKDLNLSEIYQIKHEHIPTIWDHNYTRFLYYDNISMYMNGY